MERCAKEDLKGGDPKENAQIVRRIFEGEKGHKRNAALLNAGAALYLNDKASNMEEGVKVAAALVDSGKAMETLEKLVKVSNEGV